MGMVDTLLRRKKVVTTIIEEEEYDTESDEKNEHDKQVLKNVLSDLDTRVKALELELQNYRRA